MRRSPAFRAPLAILFVAALATLALSPAPAAAWHNPGFPPVWSHPFVDRGWEAVRVIVPTGGTVIWEVQGTTQNVRMASFGFWILHPDGSLYAAYTTNYFSAAGTTVRIELAPPTGTAFEQIAPASASGFMGGAAANQVPGEWILLSIAASEEGEIPDGEFNFYASNDVTILGATAGLGTFAIQDLDFRGGVGAIAGSDGVRAKVQVDESATRNTTHRMFGLFNLDSVTQATLASYDGPDGHHGGKSRYWLTDQPAGRYQFNVDLSADVSAALVHSMAYAFGADAQLP